MRMSLPAKAWQHVLGAITIGLIACGLLSCSQSPVRLHAAKHEYDPRDYQDIIERWTRRYEVYEAFVGKAFFTATYRSLEMRRAGLAWYQNIYQLPPNEMEPRRVREENEDSQYYEFFVAVSTHQREWNNLAEAATPWRIAIINQRNEELVATAVTKEDQKSAELRSIYPYIDEYVLTYTIRFPKIPPGRTTEFVTAEPGVMTLKFSGPAGIASLTWQLLD